MTTTADSAAQGMSRADLEKFVPLNGYVLVEREGQAEKAGAIFLKPKTEDDQRREVTVGRVLRLGGEERADNGQPITHLVAEGDRVLVARYAGHDLEEFESGRRLVLLNARNDVLAVLPEDVVLGA